MSRVETSGANSENYKYFRVIDSDEGIQMDDYKKMLKVKLDLLMEHGYKNASYDILYNDPDLLNIVEDPRERNAYNQLCEAIMRKMYIEAEIEYWREKLA